MLEHPSSRCGISLLKSISNPSHFNSFVINRTQSFHAATINLKSHAAHCCTSCALQILCSANSESISRSQPTPFTTRFCCKILLQVLVQQINTGLLFSGAITRSIVMLLGVIVQGEIAVCISGLCDASAFDPTGTVSPQAGIACRVNTPQQLHFWVNLTCDTSRWGNPFVRLCPLKTSPAEPGVTRDPKQT